MTEAALAELGRGPTVALMTRRRASAPPAQPPPDAVSASSDNSVETSTPQSKQRSKSSGSASAANSENVSEGSNATKSAASKAGSSSIPAIHQNHPEELCRYPNKRCYKKRAVKNNGELHKFCDSHRDSANRYQRKLEQKLKEKRIQSRMRALQAHQAQAHAQMAHTQAHGHAPLSVADAARMPIVSPYPGMDVYGGAVPLPPQNQFSGHSAAVAPISSGNTPTIPWAQGEDEYEPFQHPVELQSEDLDCLDLLFEQ